MSSNTINFTKAVLLDLPVPVPGKRTYYRDAKEKGLIVDVRASGSKTFYLYKKIKGKPERIFLGAFPDFTIESARRDASILRGQIAEGKNPQEKKRQIRNEMTFGDLFSAYMERYSKLTKKSWIYDEREVPKFLSSWFKRKLSDIRRSEIQQLHEKIYINNGLYQANRILERIRAIFNKGIEWGWEGTNPTAGIKKYKEKSRDRFVQPDEMPYLVSSLNAEGNLVARDYFWMLLLTGARRTNTITMRWDQIGWEHKTWRIPDTKNGDPVIVPLIDQAMEILRVRKISSVSNWVFPGVIEGKHFADPKRAWRRVLQRATISQWSKDEVFEPIVEQALQAVSGQWCVENHFKEILRIAKDNQTALPKGLTDIHLHDIRRTLGSYQAIAGSSLQIIGKSLGHKSSQSTQIYSRLTLGPVRESIERAASTMFSQQR